MSSNNINDKKTNSTKISRYLKLVSIALIIIGVLIFILRIILDSIYGGAHLKSVDNIFILIGLLLSVGHIPLRKIGKKLLSLAFFIIFILLTFFNQTALFNECFLLFKSEYRLIIVFYNKSSSYIYYNHL